MSVQRWIDHYRTRLGERVIPHRVNFADVWAAPAPARQRPPRTSAEWKERRAQKAGSATMTTAGATVDRARAADLDPARAWERAAAGKHPVMLAAIRDGSVRDYGSWKALRAKLGIGGAA